MAYQNTGPGQAANKAKGDKRKELFLNSLSQGITIETACKLVGWGRSTYDYHLRVDEEFGVMVQAAKANFRVAHHRNITNHADADWKASAWLLERVAPDEYSKKNLNEVEALEVLLSAGWLPEEMVIEIHGKLDEANKELKKIFNRRFKDIIKKHRENFENAVAGVLPATKN